MPDNVITGSTAARGMASNPFGALNAGASALYISVVVSDFGSLRWNTSPLRVGFTPRRATIAAAT
mgnify:CR=1 FL=1